MGLGSIGTGLGKMAEGFTGGMVSGMQQNRMYQMQDRQVRNQEEVLKLQKQKAFFENAVKALEITPDDQMDGWLQHYNGLAPEYGFPKLTGVKRANKNEYEVKELGGKVWSYNKTTNKLQPAIDPATGQQITKPEELVSVPAGGSLVGKQTGTPKYTAPAKESWSEPEKDYYGNVVQRETGSGKVRRVAPAPPREKPTKPDMTAAQARRRFTDLTLSKARLGKGNMVDALLAQVLKLPEGQQMSDGDKQAAVQAIDEEIQSLKPYLAKSASGENARTVVRTGVYNGRKVAEYSDGTVDYYD